MAKDRKINFEEKSKDLDQSVGRNYLFVIGINAYKDIQPLENAVLDARAIAKVLVKRYQFDWEHTLELYDEAATRDRIISGFDYLAETLTDKDNLLIYYAGHGNYREKLKIGYWVPVDAKDGKYSGFINHSTIRDYIQATRAHHCLLIVDSCFSGNLLRSHGRDVNTSPTVTHANKVDRFPSRWCLAAGMIEKVSDGYIGDHSPFARSLITFLEKNDEVRFPVQDLISHVSKATSYNADQTPLGGVLLKTGDQNGQFVFDLKRDESGDWQKCKEKGEENDYKRFLQNWPDGKYTEEAFYRLALIQNSISGYRTYLEKYEDKEGRFINQVLNRMELLERQESYQRALGSGESGLRRFIIDERKRDPDSKLIVGATQALNKLLEEQREPAAWQKALQENSIESFQTYLKEFPQGKYTGVAKEHIQNIQEKIEKAQKAIKSISIRKKAEERKRLEEEEHRRREADERARRLEAEKEYTFQQNFLAAREAFRQNKYRQASRNIDMALRQKDDKEARKLQQEITASLAAWKKEKATKNKKKILHVGAGISGLLALVLLLIFAISFFRKEKEAVGSKSTSETPQTTFNTEKMVLIKGDSFSMGDVYSEGGDDEGPVHKVSLNDFYIGKYEVSFEEFDAYCKAENLPLKRDEGWGRNKKPAIHISWLDAIQYCNFLSKKHQLTPAYEEKGNRVSWHKNANGYRLPTEAEWEYAARQGGEKIRFGNGKSLATTRDLNYNGSVDVEGNHQQVSVFRNETVEVDALSFNHLGLYNMTGNVLEWCWDWYKMDYYSNSQENNPVGPAEGIVRVMRGGAWDSYPSSIRVSYRSYGSPSCDDNATGFRLARNAD